MDSRSTSSAGIALIVDTDMALGSTTSNYLITAKSDGFSIMVLGSMGKKVVKFLKSAIKLKKITKTHSYFSI